MYHYPDVGGSFIVTGEILAFASWMSLVIPVDDLRVGSGLSGSEPCESAGIWDIINEVSVVIPSIGSRSFIEIVAFVVFNRGMVML